MSRKDNRPDRLVDSHVHLDRYPDAAVVAMLRRAAEVGVTRLLTVGVDEPTSLAALRLAAERPSLLAAVGVHPTRLAALSATDDPLAVLRRLLADKPDAIGEVGLDDAAPDPEGQCRFLDGCLALARDLDLPVVLHVVGERETHLAALEQIRQYPTVRAVAHYFVGDAELASRYLDAGCWIAVGRPVTRPSETAIRQAVQVIPSDQLMLETDTYPLPGRTTEPRDVAGVCAAVADLTGRPYEDVARTTTAAFDRFMAGR